MQVQDILKDKRFQMAAVGVISAAGGTALGYFLGKRKFFKTYELVVEQNHPAESDQLEMEFADFRRPESISTVTDIIDKNRYAPIDETTDDTFAEETVVAEMQRVNVFTVDDGSWDFDFEASTRRPDQPYILHHEEFLQDEMGLSQSTVTYYVGDNIMTDELDKPIFNWQQLMGELKFGHGSKDRNVVYIRNEAMGMEWEVLRHEGMYSVEVLGLEMEAMVEAELRHSGPLKFRDR